METIFTLDFLVQMVFVVIAIIGMVLVNKKKTCNYYFFLVGYVAWAIIYFHHGVYGAVIREIIFLALNIHGLILWRRDDRNRKE